MSPAQYKQPHRGQAALRRMVGGGLIVAGDATVYKGTGNGDPSDDFDATGPVRRAWSGYARAIVRAGTTPGKRN